MSRKWKLIAGCDTDYMKRAWVKQSDCGNFMLLCDCESTSVGVKETVTIVNLNEMTKDTKLGFLDED